jgi:lipopolysaccharide transport system ATP-binding protein
MSRLFEGTGDQPMRQTGQGEVLVSAQGVSKKFCRSLKRSLWYGVQDVVSELNPFSGSRSGVDIERELREGEFWAVNDVSFELRRGECLGLIGHNGAGKTTLLKMLNGLIKPDRGHIEMRGRVGALIALGAGFNPILTGRENIYVNGSVLGLSRKEIDERIDEIVDFAGIGNFIDASVQTYSSGMHVRLGFAVATALEPDILLIDEVLAVGDLKFRIKCYNRIESIRPRTSIIIVSHNMHDISRICNTAILLDHGIKDESSDVSGAIQRYTNMNAVNGRSFVKHEDCVSSVSTKISHNRLEWGDDLVVSLEFFSEFATESAVLRILFWDQEDVTVAEWKSDTNRIVFGIEKGKNSLEINTRDIRLKTGVYSVNIILIAPGIAQYLIFSCKEHVLEIEGFCMGVSPYQLGGSLEIQRAD